MADSKVEIIVVADSSQAQKELKKLADDLNETKKKAEDTESGFGKFSSSLAEFGRKTQIIGRNLTLAISGPLTVIGKDLIQKGAELAAFEETFKQSLKGMVGSATDFASKYAGSVGMTTTQVRQQILDFNKYGKAMGMTEKDAYSFSESMVKLTNDLAAFYDVDVVDATDRMKSALMGNYEAVDKLGLAFGEATIKQEMLAEGMSGQFSDLDSTRKLWLLYNLGLKQSADAHGQATREAENFQGKLRELKGTLEELYEKVYKVMEPDLLKMVQRLTDLAQSVKGLNDEQIKLLVNIAKWAIILPPIILYFGWLAEAMGHLGNAMKFLFSGVPLVKKFFTEYGQGFKTLDGILGMAQYRWKNFLAYFKVMPKAPIWITAIIIVLSALALVIYKNWDTVKEWGKKFGEVFAQVKAWALPIIQQVIEKFMDLYNKVAPVVGKFVGELVQWFSDKLPIILKVVTDVMKALCDIFNNYIVPIYNEYFAPLIQTFFALGQAVWQIIRAVAAVIMALVQPIISIAIILGSVLVVIIDSIMRVAVVVIGLIVRLVIALLPLFANIAAVIATTVGIVIGVLAILGNIFLWVVTTIIVPVINTLVKWFIWAIEHIIIPILQTAGNWIKTFADIIVWALNEIVIPLLQGLAQFFKWVADGLNSMVTSGINDATAFAKAIMNFYYNEIAPVFNDLLKTVFDVRDQWKGVWDSAKQTFKDFVDGVKQLWKGITELTLPRIKVEGKFDLIPPDISVPSLSWYATGGIFTGPSVVGVGENGDEAVVPLSNKSKMKPFAQAVANLMPDVVNQSNNDNGDGVVINVSSLVVREEADINRIAKELYRLQEKNRRAKGVFGSV